MYKNFTFLCFILKLSYITASNYLPLQQFNVASLSLQNLDLELKARHLTNLDKLNEILEDKLLTNEQQKILKSLEEEQTQIIARVKNIYLPIINKLKEKKINRNKQIQKTILNYRQDVAQIIDKTLELKIENFKKDFYSRIRERN